MAKLEGYVQQVCKPSSALSTRHSGWDGPGNKTPSAANVPSFPRLVSLYAVASAIGY